MPHVSTALRALAIGLAMLTAPAVATAQDYAPLDTPLAIRQVPGAAIYYSIGSPGVPGKANQGNTSNAGFVVTNDGVVVFDALGTPSLGWALLEAIRKVTDKPVRYGVLSHYHAVRVLGASAFDATITPTTSTAFRRSGIIRRRSSSRRTARANTRSRTRKSRTSAPARGWRSGARRWRPGSTTRRASCRPTSRSTTASRSRLGARPSA